jgi:hypothetical protein
MGIGRHQEVVAAGSADLTWRAKCVSKERRGNSRRVITQTCSGRRHPAA